MATRKSSSFMSENYVGTRRGRSVAGDIDWSMFPKKLESTDIQEDPNMMENHNRDILSDYAPENTSLFAHEEVRRNVESTGTLNRHYGGARTTTDPWIESGYNLQFMDKDPRGTSTEQNWAEFRRHVEAQLRRTDFKDDGDYSVPSEGIHPNTMYRNIKSGMNWVRARMKIFSTSKDGRHNGVGRYHWDHAPDASKVDFEDTSVNIDLRYVPDAETRRNRTTSLSNRLHSGSKFLRTVTTTDHEVGVASYSKLRKHRGLLTHETQLRQVQDDRPRANYIDNKAVPRNLIKLMSSSVNSKNAASVSRSNMQDNTAHSDIERLQIRKDDELNNRNNVLTRDIMALMGFVEQDIKYLEAYKRKNKKHANLMLANLYNLAEVIHAMPAHMKLEVRDELLLKAAGAHLKSGDPSGVRKIRDAAQVDPKIIQLMDLMVRSTEKPGNPYANQREGLGDPENKLNHILSNAPLYVAKSASRDDRDSNRRSAEEQAPSFGQNDGNEHKTHSYKQLAILANQIYNNKMQSTSLQQFGNEKKTHDRQNARMGDSNFINDVNTTVIDNEFGDNRGLTRHVGRVGSKQMRKFMDSDYKPNDHMSEVGNHERKGVYAL